jgi:hypothetical protein
MRFLKGCSKDMRGLGFREAASVYERVAAYYGLSRSILALAGVGYGVRSNSIAGTRLLVFTGAFILSSFDQCRYIRHKSTV